MVRAPCCEKMGLKKGPWTSEEDRILINYIGQNGHGNWRALPKRAGLMRCGKSCRLRWMNYLRPDIKRGNFSTKEEETIIELHRELGNKWSVIAARLPGRTDNEIKNVWHTHLKKRLNNGGAHPSAPVPETSGCLPDSGLGQYYHLGTNSPARSSSEVSSVSTTAGAAPDDFSETAGFLSDWSEDFPGNEWTGFSGGDSVVQNGNWCGLEIDGNDFWYQLFVKHSSEEFVELPEIW